MFRSFNIWIISLVISSGVSATTRGRVTAALFLVQPPLSAYIPANKKAPEPSGASSTKINNESDKSQYRESCGPANGSKSPPRNSEQKSKV